MDNDNISEDEFEILCTNINTHIIKLIRNGDKLSNAQIEKLCEEEWALPILESIGERLNKKHWSILHKHEWSDYLHNMDF